MTFDGLVKKHVAFLWSAPDIMDDQGCPSCRHTIRDDTYMREAVAP